MNSNDDGAECPYCEHVNTVEMCDLTAQAQNYGWEQECSKCGEEFWVEPDYSVTFHSRKER